ncbi:thioredoxin-like domain-containing protein [Mucilaginibacter sp.]|uniref:TlpA family protein disulfide reductase n=1 Tax=Mucilaginibacter sp. TaxID=1882438 RepID=UPI0032631C14
MKILYTASLLLLFASCKQAPKLDLTIKADGVTNGTVQLKQASELTLNEPLKNGELSKSTQLQAPGYYSLSVIDNDKPITSKIAYDIYLENGSYTIQTNPAKPADYPAITTTSATQKELNEYYQLLNKYTGAMDRKIDSLTRYLQSNTVAALSKQDRAALYTGTREVQKARRLLDLKVLKEYTDKYPKAKIGAHIIVQVYYPEYAEAYNELFQKLPDDVKLSDDGLKIRNKLGNMLSQVAGADAPDIAGTTPDGKPFNKKAIDKKITLVEFWKPSNETSDLIHKQLVKGIILTPADQKNFGVVTVALDDKKDVWLNAIKNDNKPWQQLQDGDASTNVTKWEINTLPTFMLVDKNWKTIKSNVPFGEIDTEVHEYLKKH